MTCPGKSLLWKLVNLPMCMNAGCGGYMDMAGMQHLLYSRKREPADTKAPSNSK